MQDIINKKKIISETEVYKIQINEWYFKPINILAESTVSYNIGMSMFALELLFFESHAQFLKGTRSTSKTSQEFFIYGFINFLEYENDKNKDILAYINKNESEFYRKIRCGLFHDGYIRDGFLVDSRLEKRMEGNLFYKENGFDEDWLVNPWVLIKDLECYLKKYINDIESNVNETLSKKFYTMFNEFYRINTQ